MPPHPAPPEDADTAQAHTFVTLLIHRITELSSAIKAAEHCAAVARSQNKVRGVATATEEIATLRAEVREVERQVDRLRQRFRT